MKGGVHYRFSAALWRTEGYCGWYLVSMPADMAKGIRDEMRCLEEGWGRMKATAMIGGSEWDTAIWFDTKSGTYLLPIRADVRKREKVAAGDNVEVDIWI